MPLRATTGERRELNSKDIGNIYRKDAKNAKKIFLQIIRNALDAIFH